MNSFSILILDPRGVVSAGKNDVIERHRNYGKELAKQSKAQEYRLKLLIIIFDRIKSPTLFSTSFN